MKAAPILLLTALFPVQLLAQNRLVGKVIDLLTREPVPNATVYVNQTQLTTSTNDKGVFILKGVTPSSQVIVTHVAYEKATKEAGAGDTLLFEVLPKNASMDNVTISVTTKDNWKKWGNLFTDYFIGPGMAKKCRLLNPEEVHFYYNKKDMVLKARARKPLLVENKMLGYLLHIDLDSFPIHSTRAAFSILFPVFSNP